MYSRAETEAHRDDKKKVRIAGLWEIVAVPWECRSLPLSLLLPRLVYIGVYSVSCRPRSPRECRTPSPAFSALVRAKTFSINASFLPSSLPISLSHSLSPPCSPFARFSCQLADGGAAASDIKNFCAAINLTAFRVFARRCLVRLKTRPASARARYCGVVSFASLSGHLLSMNISRGEKETCRYSFLLDSFYARLSFRAAFTSKAAVSLFLLFYKNIVFKKEENIVLQRQGNSVL